MENPKLKKRAAIKKSQNCPRGALADNRRKYRKADWITGTRPDRRPEDQDRQLLAAGPGSEAHRHRRWRECRSLLIAAPEPCQEDGGIVGSIGARLRGGAIAARCAPTGLYSAG